MVVEKKGGVKGKPTMSLVLVLISGIAGLIIVCFSWMTWRHVTDKIKGPASPALLFPAEYDDFPGKCITLETAVNV